jgi:hypothetical protein
VRESRCDLGGDDGDEHHRGACADQAELAEAAARQRAKKRGQRDGVDRCGSATNVLEPRGEIAPRAEEQRLDGSQA